MALDGLAHVGRIEAGVRVFSPEAYATTFAAFPLLAAFAAVAMLSTRDSTRP